MLTEEEIIQRIVDAYSLERVLLALAELSLLPRLLTYLDLEDYEEEDIDEE